MLSVSQLADAAYIEETMHTIVVPQSSPTPLWLQPPPEGQNVPVPDQTRPFVPPPPDYFASPPSPLPSYSPPLLLPPASSGGTNTSLPVAPPVANLLLRPNSIGVPYIWFLVIGVALVVTVVLVVCAMYCCNCGGGLAGSKRKRRATMREQLEQERLRQAIFAAQMAELDDMSDRPPVIRQRRRNRSLEELDAISDSHSGTDADTTPPQTFQPGDADPQSTDFGLRNRGSLRFKTRRLR